ncbi:MAG: hypothetical protein JW801_06650 [Bacteroidales bacterium]|nr:hypothetical protein [Bacteroidales bacterium]
MKKRMRRSIYALMIMLFLPGCEKIVDYYIGFPQQPEITVEADTDQLNVFGVLRPDSIGGFNKSFVFVQRIWPALDFSTFSILPDVEVLIESVGEDGTLTAFPFPLSPPDANFKDTLYRPATGFTPVPGQHFRISCLHSELKDAYGELIFPAVPALTENSLSAAGGRISLSLKADSSIEMYDFYLKNNAGSHFIGRELSLDNEDLPVILYTNQPVEGAKLRIFAYENRLATYIGNSNTSLNFNKYREGFSTLDSGYGVFGALNFLDIDLGPVLK